MSEHDFTDKIAVVTGAGSGLGRAYAIALARRGATVVVNDLPASDPDTSGPADIVVREIVDNGGRAEASAGDLTDESFAGELIDATVERHGRVDILLNNAGMTAAGSIYDETTDGLRRLWDVNFWSTYWTSRSAVAHMRTKGRGRIVNTSSGFGMFGASDRIGYVTSKAAVAALTKATALDVEDDGIAVNAICPIAYTPMSKNTLESSAGFDPARFETARVVPVVLFLAHDECALTGEVLSAGADVWARIFTAKTAGVNTRSDELRDVFDNFDRIMSLDDFVVLRASREQLAATGKASDER